MKRRLLLSALVLLACACSKKEGSSGGSTSAPSPLPAAEAERGLQACNAYVARICACAETQPELVESCTLAKALPQAFQLNVDLSASAGLKGAEQGAVKADARKIAAACFEDEAKLDDQTCPRLGSTPAR